MSRKYCMMTPSKTFVREATGLVREAGWFDVFMYNEAGMGFAGSMIMTSMFAIIYLGGDFFTAWWASTILGIFIGLTYYLLSVTMPRAGADYIYTSRILHPAIGLVAAGFMGWLAALINIGYGATGWILYSLVPFLSVISFTTNNPGLADLALAASSPAIAFVIAVITIGIWGMIIGVGGLRRYLLIQNILIVITLVSTAVMMGITLTTPNSQFVAAFDSVAKSYGTSYTDVISKATQAGWTPVPTTAAQTFFLVPMILTGSWWATQSAAFAGEIKRIQRSQLIGVVIAIFVMTTIFFVAYSSLTAMVGYNFANAMAWFGFNNPSAITIPVLLPYPTVFYYGLAAKNIVLVTIIALGGGIIPMMMFIPWGIMIFSRYMFAMSFDRVLPESVSRVNERFHSPMNSVIIATVLSMVIMGLEQYFSSFPSAASWIYYVGLLANALLQVAAFISALALALLPYVRKQLYEQAFPFKQKIAGVPVATWSGIITMAILVYTLDVWFLQPPYSQLIYGGFPQIAYLAVAFGILFLLVYVAVKAYRIRQGIDLSLAFKEIPPE
jgi:APA family basic amino acid/polyamine antiporter